jgi:hypothetical protein
MGGPAITPCWQFSPKPTSSSTAGSAVAGPEGAPGSSRGVVAFLEEALALWGQRQTIRLVRADTGFFDDKRPSFLEQRCLPCIVVTRLTQRVKREAQRIQKWTELDASYAVGQFRPKLHGWTTERRFVVIRERRRESRASVGRKLIDVPGYTFRIFMTTRTDAPEEIWRDYTGVPTRRIAWLN